MHALRDLQLQLRPGIIEFGWGHPHPSLLPVEALASAAATALWSRGAAALSYGPEQGPGSLLVQVRERLGRLERRKPPFERLMVTAGNSQALDMLCGRLSSPGETVLVETPTYHLALRVLRDRGLRLAAVAGDDNGLDVAALAERLQRLRAAGEKVAFLYLVPSFGNPSGAVLSRERRIVLLELARREKLTIIEDDPYGELWYDDPPPPALAALDPEAPVARISSFAKILGPGLRLGYMVAPEPIVTACTGSGVLDSGGGVNHFAGTVLGSLIESGFLDEHVIRLRAVLRERRDALLAALGRQLPEGCSWGLTPGGYFVWVRLPEPLRSAELLPLAEEGGVAFLPGERFCAEGGGEDHLRLAFSLLPPEELDEGARRLGAVVRSALAMV